MQAASGCRPGVDLQRMPSAENIDNYDRACRICGRSNVSPLTHGRHLQADRIGLSVHLTRIDAPAVCLRFSEQQGGGLRREPI
jgi:hypothetical protein